MNKEHIEKLVAVTRYALEQNKADMLHGLSAILKRNAEFIETFESFDVAWKEDGLK